MTTLVRAFDLPERGNTYNAETREFDAIASTGAPVARRDARGPYMERLDLSAIDPAQLVGLTVFSDHEELTRTAVGTVVRAWREGDALAVTIRLSAAPDVESIRVKVAEGTIRGLSIGYTVARYRDGTEASGRRTRTAADWRTHEISLVGRPSDPASLIRSTDPMDPTPEAIAARRAEIRGIARAAGLAADWADQQIDSDADATTVRAAAFDAMAQRTAVQPPIRPAVGFSNEDPAVMHRRMVEALAADAAGVPVEDAGANQYRGAGFTGIARALLPDVPGVNRMAAPELIETAHQRSAGMMGTSEFVSALTGAGRRIALHAYNEAASPIESNLIVTRTVPDFRPVTLLLRGGLPNLQPISEHGEVQSVYTVENGTTFQIGTYAGEVGLTRAAQINDDTGLLGDLNGDLGRAARRTQTAAIVALLVSNPAMADGENLFGAAHGNLAGSGAAPSETTLSAARLAMRSQTGLGGEIIGLAPKYLVVGPALETTAEKLLASINPATADDVNPFAGKLDLLVEPRVAGAGWYVFAAPSQAPVIQVAHLAGQTGPQIAVKEGWSTLGTSWRAVFDFGAAAVDHRGAYRNAGA